ncbi:MAG: DUF1002 domain-containing protein [Christensenellaceae bacterium]|nr:DUF1002 domain-containing protein [Christensenellaceae bacterium]
MKRLICLLLAAIFAFGVVGGALAEGEDIQATPDVQATPEDVQATPEDVQATPEDVQATPEDVQATPEDVQATPEDVQATPEDAQATPEDVQATPESSLAIPGDYVTMAEGDWRVVMGADLTDAQRAQVYAIFGLSGEVPAGNVLTVTNSEERFYFEGKLPSSEIGTRSLSCIYIRAMEAGSGLDISTYNIDYCTEDMYRNVLLTVGITDAKIIVAAPVTVSGTAALTGVYKAYESLTGSILSEYAKLAGIDELLTTGQLADMIGSDEATEIINELKKILDVTKDMDDEAVKQKIREIAAEYNVELTETQVQQILTLARTLEGLDVEQIRQRVLGLVNAANGWEKFTQTVSNVVADIGNFFKEIAKFFSELFEKWFS